MSPLFPETPSERNLSATPAPSMASMGLRPITTEKPSPEGPHPHNKCQKRQIFAFFPN